MASGQTSRLHIPYPAGTDPTNVAGDMANIAVALDASAVVFSIGPASALPTSSPTTPGISGRLYFASDIGQIYFDTGTSWTPMIASATPPGAVVSFAGSVAPSGWLLCDGSAVSRATYSALFSAVGTHWGVGDGSTTFNVPDGRGRTIAGAGAVGTNTQPTISLGSTGGEQTVTLNTSQLPSHTHPATINNDSTLPIVFEEILGPAINANYLGFKSTSTFAGGEVAVSFNSINGVSASGGGGSHDNMSPYAGMYHIIKT